jgi:hypothetical protein
MQPGLKQPVGKRLLRQGGVAVTVLCACAAFAGSVDAARTPTVATRKALQHAATRYVLNNRCCTAIVRIKMLAAERSTVDPRYAAAAFDGWNAKNVEQGKVDIVFRRASGIGWRVISLGALSVGCKVPAAVRTDLGLTCYTRTAP